MGQPSDERIFQIPLIVVGVQSEEVQIIGILQDLSGLVRLGRWKHVREVVRRSADPEVTTAVDVMPQYRPGPAMLNVLSGVPLADLVVIQAVQEHRDVSPRQSRNSLLRDWCGPR
jgi:hypothetical protein